MSNYSNILWFKEINSKDIDKVGGKNAQLGEMYNKLTKSGVLVPNGFAITANAYNDFLQQTKLKEKINNMLSDLDILDLDKLATVGSSIRTMILNCELPKQLVDDIFLAYDELCKGDPNISVAVRSSATAEDLPDASFAGQQETILNVKGKDQLLGAIKEVFASLYKDRAISYRVHQGFAHSEVLLSVGIQQMIRSDLSSSGVIFTIDTESGFDKVVFITSSYGLGELVVQGSVNPDEFYVFKNNIRKDKPAILSRRLGYKNKKMVYAGNAIDKVSIVNVSEEQQNSFSITDDDIEALAKHAITIEDYYGMPMDIEWGKDGIDNKLYILQARPETVNKTKAKTSKYLLKEKGDVLIEGRSVGMRIGSGKAKIVNDLSLMSSIDEGDVLVTDMTDPDWEPIMKKASAIVTNRGGRTCHAAIIARELGIPAVVGTKNATKVIKSNDDVTISCAEGDVGVVYKGKLPYDIQIIDDSNLPKLNTKLMMNIANPDKAFSFQSIPNEGVGLARLEFIINHSIGIHPNACLNYSQLDNNLKKEIDEKIIGYKDAKSFYVQKLTEGIATLAAAFYPKPVIVRMSDFKSNEYANLIGGKSYEPIEENPMLGFRGASRYNDESFAKCFELECQAINNVRVDMGFENVQIMIPFVRTVNEAKNVLGQLKNFGLERGKNNLKVIMMCEIPSNALLATEFLEHFDGFSIGSNDLTQLTLGLDRDSGLVASSFDEEDLAVKSLLKMAIDACIAQKKYVGICGQGPSDKPEFAKWLMSNNIESMSLVPDSIIPTWLELAKI